MMKLLLRQQVCGICHLLHSTVHRWHSSLNRLKQLGLLGIKLSRGLLGRQCAVGGTCCESLRCDRECAADRPARQHQTSLEELGYPCPLCHSATKSPIADRAVAALVPQALQHSKWLFELLCSPLNAERWIPSAQAPWKHRAFEARDVRQRCHPAPWTNDAPDRPAEPVTFAVLESALPLQPASICARSAAESWRRIREVSACSARTRPPCHQLRAKGGGVSAISS